MIPDFESSAFAIDVANDLKRVDDAMTRLLKDRESWSDFLNDPNGMLIKLGLHPEATPEANAKTNRVFYAILGNKQVIDLTLDIMKDFSPSREAMEYHIKGLKNGVLQNLISLDLDAANHMFSQTEKISELYRVALRDVNDKGILNKKYSYEELDQHIKTMVQGVQNGLSISDLPTLEKWDSNYGVGTGYGFGEAEVGPAVSAAAGVEVVVAVTVVIPVAVIGYVIPTHTEMAFKVAGGDNEYIQAMDIVSRMQSFAAQLMTHVQSLDV